MPIGSFYVYALFDPRDVPPKPFYIGKGSGSRAYAHMAEEGEAPKNQRIRQIQSAGLDVIVRQLVSDLSETDALRIEAQLIAAHGTKETGGFLLNKVIPSGEIKKANDEIHLPPGAVEKAQLGLNFLKEAILELASANPDGITNADAVNYLGLHSDYNGEQKNYLSWSVLGILMREGRIQKITASNRRSSRYVHIKVGNTGMA